MGFRLVGPDIPRCRCMTMVLHASWACTMGHGRCFSFILPQLQDWIINTTPVRSTDTHSVHSLLVLTLRASEPGTEDIVVSCPCHLSPSLLHVEFRCPSPHTLPAPTPIPALRILIQSSDQYMPPRDPGFWSLTYIIPLLPCRS